jgi:hypothetical protein
MFCFSVRFFFFFFAWHFCWSFSSFQFHPSINFLLFYFSQFDPHSFNLFFFLLKLFSIQFNPPVENLYPSLIFFHHHFCVIDFFF